ncbi:hypothetical protein [Sodalis glossinidius]|uniref:hypothetical protein n=1 Tax=Sodalis glossinidius TaxID=63612 RepID=UPI0002EE6289|nr:hypothetical protein [Sodalis glossinidius]
MRQPAPLPVVVSVVVVIMVLWLKRVRIVVGVITVFLLVPYWLKQSGAKVNEYLLLPGGAQCMPWRSILTSRRAVGTP